MVQPIIKWTGSKRPLASYYLSLFPKTYNRVIEPFLGGGSFLPYYKTPVIGADAMPELINIWRDVQGATYRLKIIYRKYWNEFQLDPSETYYRIRDRFNLYRQSEDFFFLTRTCVNGIIRFNQKGDFNTSIHHGRPGMHPDTVDNLLDEWEGYLDRVDLRVADYRETLEDVKRGDMVFLDPPYPRGKTLYKDRTFITSELMPILDKLNRIGAYWMLTYERDHPDIDHSLYKRCYPVTLRSSHRRVLQNGAAPALEMVYLNYVQNVIIHR